MQDEHVRLGLVICPDHPYGETVIIPTSDGNEIELYVVRAVWKVGDRVDNYRYPPVHFTIAILNAFAEACPQFNIMLREEKCARCLGFDTPSFRS